MSLRFYVLYLHMIQMTAYHVWISAGFIVAYFAIILSCIVVVLSENRNPIRSLAWTIALLALPFIGLIFYLFFGRSMKGIHMISRRSKRKLLHNRKTPQIDLERLDYTAEECQLVKMIYSLTKSPLTLNNRVRIFTEGEDKFDWLRRDLESARESIYLQYYIFSDDETGRGIADILKRKAAEGVEVMVIYDHVGSLKSKNAFFADMERAGVKIHPFFRVNFRHMANRINWRNHRKIVVVDNRVGYIGGMNIADRYVKATKRGEAWRDTHFRVKGDIVGSLIFSFAVDWHFVRSQEPLPALECREPRFRNNTGMQLIVDGPADAWDSMALCFLKAISAARRCIYIQTPYFLPTDALLHALEAAAHAKVDVRVMLPAASDSRLLQYASFSYVTQCLRSGIKVYLYERGMLHSKTMVIDDTLVTSGSTNFDFRSFENNFECNLMFYDREINRQMREIFFEDIKQCRKLTASAWRKRPLLQRTLESLVRLVAPIL